MSTPNVSNGLRQIPSSRITNVLPEKQQMRLRIIDEIYQVVATLNTELFDTGYVLKFSIPEQTMFSPPKIDDFQKYDAVDIDPTFAELKKLYQEGRQVTKIVKNAVDELYRDFDLQCAKVRYEARKEKYIVWSLSLLDWVEQIEAALRHYETNKLKKLDQQKFSALFY